MARLPCRSQALEAAVVDRLAGEGRAGPRGEEVLLPRPLAVPQTNPQTDLERRPRHLPVPPRFAPKSLRPDARPPSPVELHRMEPGLKLQRYLARAELAALASRRWHQLHQTRTSPRAPQLQSSLRPPPRGSNIARSDPWPTPCDYPRHLCRCPDPHRCSGYHSLRLVGASRDTTSGRGSIGATVKTCVGVRCGTGSRSQVRDGFICFPRPLVQVKQFEGRLAQA